jgi:hypothetical protein
MQAITATNAREKKRELSFLEKDGNRTRTDCTTAARFKLLIVILINNDTHGEYETKPKQPRANQKLLGKKSRISWLAKKNMQQKAMHL